MRTCRTRRRTRSDDRDRRASQRFALSANEQYARCVGKRRERMRIVSGAERQDRRAETTQTGNRIFILRGSSFRAVISFASRHDPLREIMIQ